MASGEALGNGLYRALENYGFVSGKLAYWREVNTPEIYCTEKCCGRLCSTGTGKRFYKTGNVQEESDLVALLYKVL